MKAIPYAARAHLMRETAESGFFYGVVFAGVQGARFGALRTRHVGLFRGEILPVPS